MRFKTFPGLAALVALALLAVPAIASATGGVEADKYPTELQVTEEGPSYFVFSGTGPPATVCYSPTISGTLTGPSSTMGSISGMKCHVEGEGGESTLKWNGCGLQLHPGSENSFDVGPSGCGPISGLPIAHCGGAPVEITPQTGLPATYENIVVGGVGKVRAKIKTNLKFTTPGSCKSEKLMFESAYVVSATSGSIRATDGGFFISGKQSEKESEKPKFNFESNPGTASGSLEAGQNLTLGFQGMPSITCPSAAFSSQSSPAPALLLLSVSPSGCKAGESGATVSMNSCYFIYGVSNVDRLPPVLYQGTLGIGCSKAGDRIEVSFSVSGASCVTKIAPQTPASSAAYYTNSGTGSGRYVDVTESSISGLSYNYESGFCVLLGQKHTDGTLTVGKFGLHA